ncbi:MAG: hypothetical protein AAGE65_06160 [Planctomycetota bacterium]
MTRPPLAVPALIAALALPASFVAAQQRVTGGNALDANAQVGGGAVNPGQVIPDFRARNLLLTGQVTNARQFQAEIGYTAVGEFQGDLGTDDLFRFRADSFGSTRQLPQVNQTGTMDLNTGFNDIGNSDVIFTNFFNPSAGEVSQPNNIRTVINNDGNRSALITPGTSFNTEFLGSSRLASTAVGVTDVGLVDTGRRFDTGNRLGRNLGQSLGVARDAEGGFVSLDASPVFGLRETSLPLPGSMMDMPEFDPDDASPGSNRLDLDDADNRLGTPRDDARFGAGFTPEQEADPTNPLALQSADPADLDPNAPRGMTLGEARDTRRSSGRLGENANNLTSNSAVDPTLADRDPFTGLPASIQLGARLGPAGNAAGRPTQAADQQDAQRVTRLGEAIFRPLDTTAAQEGDSAYLDLLAQIRENYRQRDGDAQEQDEAQPRRDPLRQGPGRPEWMQELETPEDDLIQRAEESGLSAVANILRAQRDDGLRANRGGAGNAANAPQSPEAAATNQAMEALIDQLSFDLPRLETLQGQREDRINRHFANAQEAMAKGQFFKATALYEQLVIDAPGNPLARVGLTHAQMGAGLIRSSALQLRRLFEDHPELIAVRYAENLLPPRDRTVWLRNELQRAVDDPNQSNAEPALLLAYLGHQAESRQLVRYGLALAQEAKPLDPLLPLLRQIWLGEALDVEAE